MASWADQSSLVPAPELIRRLAHRAIAGDELDVPVLGLAELAFWRRDACAVCVPGAGVEPTRPFRDPGFLVLCVCQFRHPGMWFSLLNLWILSWKVPPFGRLISEFPRLIPRFSSL